MCGICGFVSKNNISLSQLESMNNTMVHRGPDDAGEEIVKFDNDRLIGLAHRRLSILDLSENGHQPFHSNNGDITVVFNGEIYNFLELKKELKDYTFFSECDTEVIVAAYLKWKTDFVYHIDGMFSIALFDRANQMLVLTRDRIGKKPLYYYDDGTSFVFGSTLKSLMAFPGFHKEIDKSVIPRFLYNKYIAGDKCILANVKKLRPGEMLVYKDNELTQIKYWDLIENYQQQQLHQIKDFAIAKNELKEKLTESVRKRMVADVPVGTFLSGGFDSSLVTAIAQNLSDKPVKTFSIGFTAKEYDEAPYAEAVASFLGTDHTTRYVSEEDMFDLVTSIPDYYDEPFADSSQIPSMLVAKIAKEQVSVVLTGDGGDEFFCGYNIYDKLGEAERIEPFAKPLRLLFKPIEKSWNILPFSVNAVLKNTRKNGKTQFGRNYYEESIRNMLDCDADSLPYDESYIPVKNWQIRRMLLDSTTYLPDNNLCKVDRATMRYSLEARNPLLDTSVIKTSFRIPHKFKYYKKDKKHILKELTYDYIPKNLMERPKMGFAVPIDQWLRGPLKEDLLSVTNYEYLKSQDVFNPEFTEKFVLEYLKNGDAGSFSGKNPSHIVWPLYMFQKWYQRYFE